MLIELYSSDLKVDSSNQLSKQELLSALGSEEFVVLETALNSMIATQVSAQLTAAESIMSDLLLYTNFSVDSLIASFINVEECIAYSLFRGGGAKTKKALYHLLPSNPDLGLKGLAWIADEEIVSQFVDWKNSPPRWASQIFLPAYAYSYEAGWELTPDNRKRELFSRTCFGVSRNQLGGSLNNIHQPDACSLCRRSIYSVKVDPSYMSKIFPMVLPGTMIELFFCDLCTGLAEMHSTINEQGIGVLSSSPLTEDDVPEWYFEADNEGGALALVIDADSRDPFYAADGSSKKTMSQLGGYPTWLQDAQYPKCARCERTMRFIMQMDTDEFENLYPGIFYTFGCDLCSNRLAVTKQNT